MEEIMTQMIKVVKSRYPYGETVERIKEKTKELGWSVIGEHDLAEKIGVKLTIIEVCNKDFARKALEKPENRWISAFMPCHFSVVENPDGVYVYCMNMGLFAKMAPPELGEVLSEVSKVDEEIVSSIL
ncbi:DUF302 domain-containing protein [Thermococcus sp. AM4]|uniref:DUF302 domain-containing protein n=1 Tax=Thermococcus sp. (strain AM4) TaxID=246969 RepID=UPI0001870C38|nr:DUF302 domain-containing protein [Thermococcus sp. AM4]EEB73541.1 conserved hypothetical protein [Thermococcus sp. AM4]